MRLSFTGFLVRPRREAIAAAKRAGAVVQSKPGQSTDVLVRGRPNALQIAGKDGGSKLIDDPPSRREGTQGDGDRRASVLEARVDASTAEARKLTLEYRPQRIGVAVSDHFPRVRRIGLSIKTEDFSRRIMPAPDAAKALRSQPQDLNGMVGSDGVTTLRVDEATSTELTS